MQLEGGKINNLHLTFLVTGYTLGASVIISPGTGAGHDAWLTILVGLVIGLFFAYIFFSLANKFPGKNLIEINDSICGPYLGKVISLLYLFYFYHLASLVLRNFGDFFTTTIYPTTPIVVLIGITTLITASAVRNGIEVITRCSLILVPLTLLSFILLTILILPQTEFNRLLPILELPFKVFVKRSFSAATFPFGDTVVFLMITANLNNNFRKLKKFALSGLTISGIFLIIIAARNIAIQGITYGIDVYPSYTTIQLINIGDILTRLEVAFIFTMFSMGFLKICVLYYSTVLGTAQLFHLRSYLPLVLPIGAGMVVLSITQFDSSVENLLWDFDIYPFYALLFQFFLPLLSLILAKIKVRS